MRSSAFSYGAVSSLQLLHEDHALPLGKGSNVLCITDHMQTCCVAHIVSSLMPDMHMHITIATSHPF